MELPKRYNRPWTAEFEERVRARLRPGISLLDVGGGATPTVAPEARPADVHYVGFDVSGAELERAGSGAYAETVEADIVGPPVPGLDGRFDLITSFQVLEHVKPLERAFENMERYLRPGGEIVVQFSGALTFFALVNRAIPHALGAFLLTKITARRRESIFPAYYHRCYASAVRRLLADWDDVTVTPLYRGMGYYRFFEPLRRAYLVFENWACEHGHENLATYFVVTARRRGGAEQ